MLEILLKPIHDGGVTYRMTNRFENLLSFIYHLRSPQVVRPKLKRALYLQPG